MIWTLLGENLSSGFQTRKDSNQSAQLQRLARKKMHTNQRANNKGADQIVKAGLQLSVYRRVCSFAIHMQQSGFLAKVMANQPQNPEFSYHESETI